MPIQADNIRPKTIYTLSEAHVLVDCSPTTLYRKIKASTLKAKKTQAGWLITGKELLRVFCGTEDSGG